MDMLKLTAEEREKGAEVMKALGHPLRLGIVQELAEGEKSVSELTRYFGCGQSMMSQQLRLLESQGLIQWRKDGTSKFCSIRNDDFLKLFSCLKKHLDLYFKCST
ncbi:MAG: metalloregulator ArsR/SmtB family transcription factor [Lentisphaeria bacterium]|nr:metalloregulator ArsR/SmtB family transcription factor [Lentisphaeria bacterium]